MSDTNIKNLQKRVFENKVKKGLNTKRIEPELLLLTEEVGEVIRAYRRESKEKVAEELADVVIYCLGLFEILGRNAQKEILKKVKRNEDRIYGKVSRQGWEIREKK